MASMSKDLFSFWLNSNTCFLYDHYHTFTLYSRVYNFTRNGHCQWICQQVTDWLGSIRDLSQKGQLGNNLASTSSSSPLTVISVWPITSFPASLSPLAECWQTLQRPPVWVHAPGVAPRPVQARQPAARLSPPTQRGEFSQVSRLSKENHVHTLAENTRLLHLQPPAQICRRLPMLKAGVPQQWGRVWDLSLISFFTGVPFLFCQTQRQTLLYY